MSACECRRREQPWSQQRRESHPKRRYQVAERKMCQPGRKLSWTRRCSLMSTGSTCSSKQSCRILLAHVSTCRPEAEFLRDIDADSEEWNSQSITLERTASTNKNALCDPIGCINWRTPSRAQAVHEFPHATLGRRQWMIGEHNWRTVQQYYLSWSA